MATEKILVTEITQPKAEHLAPGQELPLPSDEQARAADEVFSREDPGPAIVGLWTAGMVLQDLVREGTRALTEEEQQDDRELPAKKHQ